MTFLLRSSLDGSRSSLDVPRSPLDPPLTPPFSKRQSHLSKTLATAKLEPSDKDNKPSKRERTKNILKKVFGASNRDSKPPPPRPPPHLAPIGRRESLSKRKAPNLTISIQPVSKPSPLSLAEDLDEQPTPASLDPFILSPDLSIAPSNLPIVPSVSDIAPPLTPPRIPSTSPKTPLARSQSPHRPTLPYTMHHLTSSRESLNTSLNRDKSHSSSSLNDQYNNANLSPHRLTHTADGLRIPRLESEVPRSIGQGGLGKRDKSPARPLSFPKNSASKAVGDQRRSVNLLELRSALGGWDCEADAEDAKEHVLEMKKKAMEREERRRRSWDLEKDWNRWEISEQGGGGRKEVRWNF